MSKQMRGRIGLIIVAIIWGSGFTFSAVALDFFSPFQILAIRFTIAFLLMCLFFFKQFKHINIQSIKKGIILGVFLYFAFMFQTIGLVYTTPSKNAFLTAFNVVLVPVITAIVYKKGLNRASIIGALLSIIGVAIMSLDNFTQINIGDLLTLICALFFALQIFYTNEFVQNENIFVLNTIQIGTAAVLGNIVALVRNDAIQPLTSRGVVSVIYLGAISTMLAFLLQTAAQRYTTGTETAIILSTEAVFGMVFSAILLKEVITGKMLLGSALILAGVLIVQLAPRRKNIEAMRKWEEEKLH